MEGEKGRRVGEKLRGLEGAWRTQNARAAWLAHVGGAEGALRSCVSAGDNWGSALGTIGLGNHFAEVQVLEEIRSGSWPDANPAGPEGMLSKAEVLLLVYSGSRGSGGDRLKRYTAGGQNSMPVSDPVAAEYLTEYDWACQWASKIAT